MKYTVEQTFETLGHNARSSHRTRAAAEAQAERLQRQIAKMIAGWEIPDHQEMRTGYANEINAWEQAERIAGVQYDDDGNLTTESPRVYGIVAGRMIARQAVAVRTRGKEQGP